MTKLWLDLRYAVRLAAKTPATTLLTVILIAVGIGANASVITVVDALYLKPLRGVHAGGLVHVYAQRPGGLHGAGFSLEEYRRLRLTVKELALAGETTVAQLHIVGPAGIREARGAFVSGNYFPLLGVMATQGRVLDDHDDLIPDGAPFAVISQRFSREYLGDGAAVGAPLRVNGVVLTVVGVVPAPFAGDDPGRGTDVWLPMSMLNALGYGCPVECTSVDYLVGKLAPGGTLRTARAEAQASIAWSPQLDPDRARPRRLVVLPIHGADPDTQSVLAPQMAVLMSATTALLLIACANLAGLAIAVGIARRREIAVRLSIGATRWHVVRQLLTESLLLTAAGGVGGLLCSLWGTSLVSSFYSRDSEGFVHGYDFALDWRVTACALAIALASGLIIGLMPALRLSRPDFNAELKDGRGSTGSRSARLARRLLVAAQVSLSIVLVVASGALARSGAAIRAGTNFDPGHLAVLRLRPGLAAYSDARADAFIRRADQRLRDSAGVAAVAMMAGGEGLMWKWDSGRTVHVGLDGRGSIDALMQHVDAPFFTTLRIPIRSGRAFTDDDRAGSMSVAIVNETLERHLWPNGGAIGRTLVVGGARYQVVGVSAVIQPPGAMRDSPHVYLPFWQAPAHARGDVRFAVRVGGDATRSLPALRAAVRELDPAIPLGEDMSMEEQVRFEYAPVLLAARVVSFAGLVALVLSAIGLYSVLAFAVRTGTREIGVRMALGAQPGVIARQYLSDAAVLGLAGVAFGLPTAWLLTRLLSSILVGVTRGPGAWFAVAAVVVLGTSIAAGYLPSRRASRVDPIAGLRAE